MQLSNNLYNRQGIRELPYEEFIPGRLWTPTFPTDPQQESPLTWTTVLVPAFLNQIESREEYFLLLARRIEYLISQAVQLWLTEYKPHQDKEAEYWVAMQINEYMPMYLNSLGPNQTPLEMAIYLVQTYQELQSSCQLDLHTFPVPPHPAMETSFYYLDDMNLTDWLAFMNMEANPHYFQD